MSEIKGIELEKLKQIISRTDKSGNEKVLLMLDFIYLREQQTIDKLTKEVEGLREQRDKLLRIISNEAGKKSKLKEQLKGLRGISDGKSIIIKQLEEKLKGLRKLKNNWIHKSSLFEEIAATEIEKNTKLKEQRKFPTNNKIKKHIDSLPYYGSCTTEYNEGFEDGVKWIKQLLTKNK